jgi:prevent-host-death family protein
MRRVGIRELRQRASELIRDVEKGTTIEVTDRGRPVALLTPVRPMSARERLRAEGAIIEPTGRLDDLGPPLPLEPGQEPPSLVLARLRADER